MAMMNGLQVTSEQTTPSEVSIREMVVRKMPKGKTANLFSNREIKGRILPFPENQIKQNKGKIKIGIDPIIYNEMMETSSHQRPTVLFVCTWPAEKYGPIIFSKEALSMICTCYWFLPSKKTKPSNSGKNINIEIPDDQFLDEEAFEKIFDEIYV